MNFDLMRSFHNFLSHEYATYIIFILFAAAWIKNIRRQSSSFRQLLSIPIVSVFIHFIICWRLRELRPSLAYQEQVNLLLGVIIIVVSIKSKPHSWLETLSTITFRDSQRFKSLFIGLTQFIILQAIGWHLFRNLDLSIVSSTTDYKGLEIQNLLQTVGGIIAIVFASWQFSASAAEQQYQSGGTLQLEKSEELYVVLRLLLSPLFGVLLFSNTGRITVEATNVFQGAGLLYLIPFSAMLFKETRLPSLVKRHSNNLSNITNELFRFLNNPRFFEKRFLGALLKDLENVSLALNTLIVWAIQKRKVKLVTQINQRIFESTISWIIFVDNWRKRLDRASPSDIMFLEDQVNHARLPKISFLHIQSSEEPTEINFETSNLHTLMLFHIIFPIGEAIDFCIRNHNRHFVDFCKMQKQITAKIEISTEEEDFKEYLALLLGVSLKTIEAMPTNLHSEDTHYFYTHTKRILRKLESLDRGKNKYKSHLTFAKYLLKIRDKI